MLYYLKFAVVERELRLLADGGGESSVPYQVGDAPCVKRSLDVRGGDAGSTERYLDLHSGAASLETAFAATASCAKLTGLRLPQGENGGAAVARLVVQPGPRPELTKVENIVKLSF